MAASENIETTTLKIYDDFCDMDIHDSVLRGVYSYGFEKPTEIQKSSIVPIKDGKDLIAQAQSGMGKTGAFGIGMLERIDPSIKSIQGLVILPTHELATQVYKVITSLSTYMGLNVVLAIGKSNGVQQVRCIREGCHIMVGTPGRIYDLIVNRVGCDCMKELKITVIDEADEMLSYGFQDQIREIIQKVPSSAQICLFSATMNNDVLSLTSHFMRDPVKILLDKEEVPLKGIKQYYVMMREQDKFPVLMDLYDSMTITQCVIFCNNRSRVDDLASNLEKNGFTVSAIHGQIEGRQKEIDDFKSGKTRVLIGTDIVARGLDVQQVSIVINYDITRDVANYMHRIGRSGRLGRKGVAINFVTEASWDNLKMIEEHYKVTIDEMPADFISHINP